ncbi:MAG: hypothetical protein ACJARX_000600 [Psychroserpens sp.]|jgi:hypothetical protein
MKKSTKRNKFNSTIFLTKQYTTKIAKIVLKSEISVLLKNNPLWLSKTQFLFTFDILTKYFK